MKPAVRAAGGRRLSPRRTGIAASAAACLAALVLLSRPDGHGLVGPADLLGWLRDVGQNVGPGGIAGAVGAAVAGAAAAAGGALGPWPDKFHRRVLPDSHGHRGGADEGWWEPLTWSEAVSTWASYLDPFPPTPDAAVIAAGKPGGGDAGHTAAELMHTPQAPGGDEPNDGTVAGQ